MYSAAAKAVEDVIAALTQKVFVFNGEFRKTSQKRLTNRLFCCIISVHGHKGCPSFLLTKLCTGTRGGTHCLTFAEQILRFILCADR